MNVKMYLKSNYSNSVILTAEKLVEDSKVIRVKKEKNDSGNTVISAKVLDEFNYVSHAKVIFDDDGVDMVSCDCPTIRDGGTVCEHTAALLKLCIRDFPFDAEKNIGADHGEIENDLIAPDIKIKGLKRSTKTEESKPSAPLSDFSKAFNDTNDYSILSADNMNDDAGDIDALLGLDIPEDDSDDEGDDDDDGETPCDDSEIREMKILFGNDIETGEAVYWHPNDTEQVFHTNTGIIGTMGTGKTQFTKSLVTQIYNERRNNYDGAPIGILIFDYKGDYNEEKTDFVKAVNANVIKPYNIPYNPLSLNLKRSNLPKLPLHTANAFKDTLSKIYNLGGKQQGILLECIKAAYADNGIDMDNKETWSRPAPTFEQVYRVYERLYSGRDADLLSNMMTRLHDFSIFEPVPEKAGSLMKLLRGVVVFDISGYDPDIQSLVVAITLDHFYSQMQALGSSRTDGRYRQLRKLILVDEADNFMDHDYPSLRKIMKEGREFGVGIILSTQSLKHFVGGSDDYSRYILTWAVHNSGDLSQKDVEYVFKLEHKDAEIVKIYADIKKLQKHESIIKISNNKLIKIRDKAFWQLYKEIEEQNAE